MGLVRATGFLLLPCMLGTGLRGVDAPPEAVRVCEVLSHPAEYNGKTVALVGRYSFREAGRFLSEQSCGQKPSADGGAWPNTFRLAYDPKSGPRAPENFELDARSVREQLALVKKATTLGKFRFGSPDYDRWAVVYGRVEISPEFAKGAGPKSGRKSTLEPAPAQLVFRGDALIVFLADQ